MLTDLGKFLRKLRIDCSELLKNMADKLSITPAYLSAIETNKRLPPKDFLEKIKKLYSLNGDDLKLFEQYFINSRNEKKVDMNSFNESDKNLMLSFARKLNNMNSEEKERIKNILSKI